MPAPDIEYFLDCSIECGHLTPDVYHHFMYDALDANDVVDGYREPDNANFGRHWNRLIDMARHVERAYESWRIDHPQQAKLSSLYAAQHLHSWLDHSLRETAHYLVDKGKVTLDEGTLAYAEDQIGLVAQRARIERCLARIRDDLDGLSSEELIQLSRRATVSASQLGREGLLEHLRSTGQIKRPTSDAKRRTKFVRQVTKRSIRIFEQIMGTDTTRLFIGGDKLRIEGRKAIYEIKSNGNMSISHGGAKLSVFDKQHDIHLCDLCIFTPNVPMLDHVASLIMHIRAGEEEEILRIGNAFNLDAKAYEQPWLVPYLPERVRGRRRDGSEVIPILFDRDPPVENRQAKIAALTEEVMAFCNVEPTRAAVSLLPLPAIVNPPRFLPMEAVG